MATQAHCAYCFETLSAKLEKRTPLTLRQVEQLWKQYNADPSAPDPNAPGDADADDDAMADDAEEGDDVDGTGGDAAPASNNPHDPSYRPAAISRLLAPSPSTRSSSSVQSTASTPSGASEASSSATSKNSSRSSIFSLGRRLRREEKARSADEGSPLFVTWNVISSRGCIGTFEAQELDEGLRSYALTSAFDDTRFPPIAPRELPTLECGVTLLTHFEPAADPLDWSLGTHGLRISFALHGRRYGATYLPDVAREQGWTKEETVVSLMRKAGWSGRKEDWTKVELGVVRYQGRQVRLGYREWRAWRDWVEEGEV